MTHKRILRLRAPSRTVRVSSSAVPRKRCRRRVIGHNRNAEPWPRSPLAGTGNAVFLFPDKRAVIVVTTTNFNEWQPHGIMLKLITNTKELLPALR